MEEFFVITLKKNFFFFVILWFLQDGICADRFWLDREHCCWSANDSVYKDADCSAWTSWPEMMQFYERNFFYYVMELFFYCGWSVLMTGVTVALVKVTLMHFHFCVNWSWFLSVLLLKRRKKKYISRFGSDIRKKMKHVNKKTSILYFLKINQVS